MISDFGQCDTVNRKTHKIPSGNSIIFLNTTNSLADTAIQLIQTSTGNGDLRSLLKGNKSLVETARDWAGDGLLAIAAWHGKPEIVRMLLNEFDMNVNSENFKKTTPLHRASAGGCMICVEILLNRGADVEFCDATGRTPADVGSNEAVREMIKERIKAAKEVVKQFHISLAKADREFEEKTFMMNEASKDRKIASRLNQAVPIIFAGALNDDANGAYDPIYELHDEWPIYRKRESKAGAEIVLLYVAAKSSWIIKTLYVGQNYDEVSLFDSPAAAAADWKGRCLVTMFTGTPSFPELRLEGSNGILEAAGPRRPGNEMTIIPESEWIGELEMEKLRSNIVPTNFRDSS